MGFKCGIVGLPNVGKSTLFNALTQTAAAQAANYPFCTIEPNVGEVAVPDPRLEKLAELAKSAGDHADAAVVRRHRRAWCAAPRRAKGSATSFSPTSAKSTPSRMWCAASTTATSTHVEGRIDPIADIDTVETELMLADLESLERRIDALEKNAKGNDEEAKEAEETLDLVQRALALLREGKPARARRAHAARSERRFRRSAS